VDAALQVASSDLQAEAAGLAEMAGRKLDCMLDERAARQVQ
jgi:hypothetical protein